MVLFCTLGFAHAENVAPTAKPNDLSKQVLLLDIEVNHIDTHIVAQVEVRDGVLFISRQDLAQAGIQLDDKGVDSKVSLDSLEGVRASVDEGRQVLVLIVELRRVAPQLFELRPQQADEIAPAGLGLILGYDVSAATGDIREPVKTGSLATTLQGSLFTPEGVLLGSGFFQAQHGGSQFVRLDTTGEFDDPARVRRLLLGDFISGGLAWSRSVRMNGFQFGTDFTLQPAMSTLPLPDFFGQTAVPATVDLFINSVRVYETDVQPGPFELHDLPVLTGSGDARVVVRDLLGHERTETLSLYATDQLLSAGLWSYTFDAGFLRQHYGVKSFDYGPFATTATAAYGLTSWLTLSAHSETGDKVHLLGGGGAFSLAPFGAVAADVASANDGSAVSVQFERRARHVSLFGSWSETSREFRDIASIGSPAPPRLRLQLGGSYAFAGTNSLGLSYIDVHEKSGKTKIATASFTTSFGGCYFGTTGFYDVVRRSWSVEAFLSLSIDNVIGSADAGASSAATSLRLSAIKPVDPDGGFGYRATVSAAKMDSAGTGVSWYGEEASVDADVAETNGKVSSQVLASGGVVLFGDSIYATQRPDGAVALIRTGVPGVRIERENRLVAVTDSDGEALIAHLIPYAPNRIGVDPRDFPITSVMDKTQTTVAAPRNSGVVLDFSAKSGRSVLISVVLANGTFPVVGSSATIESVPGVAVVGERGEIFIDNLEHGAKGEVDWGTGRCAFHVDLAQQHAASGITRVGPVVCEPEQEER